MEELLVEFIGSLASPLLALVICVCLVILGKSADLLVEEAVALSTRSGISKVVIGATIVSLGTTTPEAVVSVLAAVRGQSGLALGNAVGSIICDTGLILGLACLISPPRLERSIVNRQGWIQFASGILLVAACFPWTAPREALTVGGRLPQLAGFLFLALLLAYLWLSVWWARGQNGENNEPATEDLATPGSTVSVLGKLLVAIVAVVAASWVLIPSVAEAAQRLSVPESVIAATMVAFGTSLPELVTAVTAARQGHGELAVGNVIGADILNVLFVAGASAAVTGGGLPAPGNFFSLYFPSMIAILTVFRVGVWLSGDRLQRPFGIILLGCYLMATVFSYVGG